MLIYLFRDERDNENFALSIDVTGANIPPAAQNTEWIFVEAINTLKFVEPWDIGDLDHALNHLKADGYYMFSGAIIAPLGSAKHEQLPES